MAQAARADQDNLRFLLCTLHGPGSALGPVHSSLHSSSPSKSAALWLILPCFKDEGTEILRNQSGARGHCARRWLRRLDTCLPPLPSLLPS
jgi:hypothetical protein